MVLNYWRCWSLAFASMITEGCGPKEVSSKFLVSLEQDVGGGGRTFVSFSALHSEFLEFSCFTDFLTSLSGFPITWRSSLIDRMLLQLGKSMPMLLGCFIFLKVLFFLGLQVVYDVDKPPGSRVVKAKARSPNPKIYADVVPGVPYNVVTSSYVYGGGDNFTVFKEHNIKPSHVLSELKNCTLRTYTYTYTIVSSI